MKPIPVKAAITAIGGYVPEHILDNFELEKRVETSNEWILSRTGIAERRILDKSLATSDMAARAIQDLLTDHKVKPEEIDCLLVATSTPDFVLTPTAPSVAVKSGLGTIPAIDMNGACSGFLYALSTASMFIESGRFSRVLVVGADTNSRLIDYTDRNTCILFGDGAGAVLLEASDTHGLEDFVLGSDGSGEEFLVVPAGGSNQPASEASVAEKLHFVRQDGKTVFRNAVRGMTRATKEVLERSGLSASDIDWVVPHQANIRIIQSVAEELELPMEKVKVNISRYGNTTAATLPLCLWDHKHDFGAGERMVLTAFGAGFTYGSALLNWAPLR